MSFCVFANVARKTATDCLQIRISVSFHDIFVSRVSYIYFSKEKTETNKYRGIRIFDYHAIAATIKTHLEMKYA